MIAATAAVGVSRLWPDQPFVVVGAGPSLCQDDLDYIRDLSPRPRVIVINDAYRLAPWADVLYAADARWWQWHAAVPHVDMPFLKYAAQPDSRTYREDVIVLDTKRGAGVSDDSTRLMSGGHGGHQAINLAVHLGASSIILLGFDMCADRATGANHFHGEHPNGKSIRYAEQLPVFPVLAAALAARSIPIVNCSRQTAIPTDVIPHVDLRTALDASAHAA